MAEDSLSELQFPRFTSDLITLFIVLQVHSSSFSESTSERLSQETCTKTSLAPSDGYGNVCQCETELFCGTSQAHRFAWMAGSGRPFANLTEWGQRFMATPNPAKIFCWFLHLIKSNFLFSKGTFPPPPHHFGRLVGFGLHLAFVFKIKRASSFQTEGMGNRKDR